MILIYHQYNSHRLQYILSTLFQNKFESTNSIETFIAFTGIKINYSNSIIDANEIQIVPHTLLFENTILPQTIDCVLWKELPTFFNTSKNALIPFDLFAASFFLITRYEEYLPHQKDKYGRYAHTNSIAYRHQFLHLPIIHVWLIEFEKICQSKNTNFSLAKNNFNFLPTYDIDIAYQYKYHKTIKTMASIVKDIVTLNIIAIKERYQMIMNIIKDPFDVYDWLQQLHNNFKLQPIYFFLVAQQINRYDKNINVKNIGFKKLVQQIAQQNIIGIHPSWQSNTNDTLLQQEIITLQNISQQKIFASRQHYIKLNLPHTFRLLIQQKIYNDYSMGYTTINGFRASYTLPHYWFDIEKNAITNLLIHPFCYMDATAIFEKKLTIAQAQTELQALYDVVKKVNGTCIAIFHNHFLTTQKKWKPWRNLHQQFLNKNTVSSN